MCLEVLVQIADGAPGRIGAKRLGELAGLVVTSGRLNDKPALHLSVTGGCSCDFLARGPHTHSGSWNLNSEHLPKLAAAIRALNTEARKYRFLAHWLGGDSKRSEVRVSGAELLDLVESNQLGDNVVYRTWSGRGS
jgi:hypothetical protein